MEKPTLTIQEIYKKVVDSFPCYGIYVFVKDAQNGDGEAMFELGKHILEGDCVKKHEGEGLLLIATSAKAGNQHALEYLVQTYEADKSFSNNFKLNKKLAQLGSARGVRGVAECYEKGDGVAQNDALAVVWYLKGAEQGNVVAQYKYGEKLLLGVGIEKDVEEAFKWIELSANKRYPQALLRLAQMYRDGVGCKQDVKKAQQLEKEGNANSNLCVNWDVDTTSKYSSLLFGDDTWDFNNWLDNKDVNSYCKMRLALHYLNGECVDKDVSKAMALLKDAAQGGDKFAQYFFAKCLLEDAENEWLLEQGLCVKRTPFQEEDVKGEVLGWLKKSAAQGCYLSYELYAYCLENGIGINRSPFLAKKYLMIADKYKKKYNL